MNFCLIPDRISPLNKYVKVTQLDGETDLGMRILNQSKPIKWMILLTLISLFDVIPLSASLPLYIRQRIETFMLIFKGAASSLNLIHSLYEFSRPVYKLKDVRTKRELAIAQTGFTKRRKMFKFVARLNYDDYESYDKKICTASFEENGNLLIKWNNNSYSLEPLPQVKDFKTKAAGYIISVSNANVDILNTKSIRIPIFHSRKFCIEEDQDVSKNKRIPSHLFMLVLYFWEHNGSVSLVNVAINVGFLNKFVSGYQLSKSRKVLTRLENEDDWDSLWRHVISKTEEQEERQKIIVAYKNLHPNSTIPPLLQNSGKIQVLNELKIDNYSSFYQLFLNTFHVLKDMPHLYSQVFPNLTTEFQLLTTRPFSTSHIFKKNKNDWREKLSFLGECVGVENLRTVDETFTSIASLILKFAQCYVKLPAQSYYSLENSQNWIAMFLDNFANADRQYRTLTGKDFPLKEDVFGDLNYFDLKNLSQKEVDAAYVSKGKKFSLTREINSVLQFKRLDESYKNIMGNVPPINLKLEAIPNFKDEDYEKMYQDAIRQEKDGWFSSFRSKENYYRVMTGRYNAQEEQEARATLNLANLDHTPSLAEVSNAIVQVGDGLDRETLKNAFLKLYPNTPHLFDSQEVD